MSIHERLMEFHPFLPKTPIVYPLVDIGNTTPSFSFYVICANLDEYTKLSRLIAHVSKGYEMYSIFYEKLGATDFMKISVTPKFKSDENNEVVYHPGFKERNWSLEEMMDIGKIVIKEYGYTKKRKR